MREYETVYILSPDLPPATLTKIQEKVQKALGDQQAKIVSQRDWGKRKMAYRVGKFTFGHYFYVNYSGPGTCIAELERSLKYEEDVIRFLTVKLGDTDGAEEGKKKKIQELEELKFNVDEFRPPRDFDGPRPSYRNDFN